MKINVTVPSGYTYRKLVKKTRSYMKGDYNKKVAKTVFEGKDKGYYAWIKKGTIQIEVIDHTKENVKEIQNYLEYMFYKRYIGISTDHNPQIDLKLKNVRCYKV